jgi:hypothetical protein
MYELPAASASLAGGNIPLKGKDYSARRILAGEKSSSRRGI